MGNQGLSPEEIEVLLKSAFQDSNDSPGEDENESITDMEKDAIGEMANISMGSAATSLSQLLGKKVDITTPKVDLLKAEQIGNEFSGPSIISIARFKSGMEGFNLSILSQKDGAIIFDLMTGGDGHIPVTELNDPQISGIKKAMNGMMASVANSLSMFLGQSVEIFPPELAVTDFSTDQEIQNLLRQSEPLVRILFRLQVENVTESFLAQVFPLRAVKKAVETMMMAMQSPITPLQSFGVGDNNQTLYDSESLETAIQRHSTVPDRPPAEEIKPQPTTPVMPAQFAQLQPVAPVKLPENLELVLDVPLQVSVELGRAKKTIREIMNLGPGAVIELNRIAGEPVDMIVNGKLIAKCEVVVINESFGIRITDIVHPTERIKSIN